MSHRMYCVMSIGDGNRINDPTEIAPLSLWLIFLLHRLVFWFRASMMYTNRELSSELEDTLAKISRVNFIVDCCPCPFFKYTLADDSLEGRYI